MIFVKLFYDNFWDNSPSFYLFVPKKKRGEKDSLKSCPKNGSTNIISLNKSTAILYAKIQPSSAKYKYNNLKYLI